MMWYPCMVFFLEILRQSKEKMLGQNILMKLQYLIIGRSEEQIIMARYRIFIKNAERFFMQNQSINDL